MRGLVSLFILTSLVTQGHSNEDTHVMHMQGWLSKAWLCSVGFIPMLVYILSRCVCMDLIHY
jgi:hypothetical protein